MTELMAQHNVAHRLTDAQQNDLPEVQAMELEAASAIYVQGMAMQELGQLAQGYAACCYRELYGQKGIKKLAAKVNDLDRTLRAHAQVYDQLINLNSKVRADLLAALRERRLSYTHLKNAGVIESTEDRGFLLGKAIEHGWTAKEF